MKNNIVKTIFHIIYIPVGLFTLVAVLGLIAAIFLVLIGQGTLSDILLGVIGVIVLGAICAGLTTLEKKLTGEE